jgi:hypothetical protein
LAGGCGAAFRKHGRQRVCVAGDGAGGTRHSAGIITRVSIPWRRAPSSRRP